MSETCPFIISKGARKGQVCGLKSKSSTVKYCRHHIRNIGVQQELINNGVDIDSTIKNKFLSDTRVTSSPTVSREMKPINPSYAPPIIKRPVTKEAVKEEEDSLFVTAFSRSLDTKLKEETVDMDRVYDDDDEEDNANEDNYDIDTPTGDTEITRMRKEIEMLRQQQLISQRRIEGMFCMKQVIFVGVKTVAEIAEGFAPETMNGYTKDVLTSESINSILDEMSADLEVMSGYADQPAYIRLAMNLSSIAAVTCIRNQQGYLVQKPADIPCPQPSLPGNEQQDKQQEDKDFTPAYKE